MATEFLQPPKVTTRRLSLSPERLPLAFAAVFAVASTNYSVFPGLPFTSPAALLVVMLAVPFVFSSSLRADYGAWIRARFRTPRLPWLGLLGLLVMNAVLLASGTHSGFSACYRAIDVPGPPGCERSFNNPLFRFHLTRLDRALDFGPTRLPAHFVNFGGMNVGVQLTNWSLGFLNSNRFNFVAKGEPDVIRQAWPRFTVRWNGTVAVPRGRTVRMTYVGEGEVRAEAFSQALPASYASAQTATLALPTGRHDVTIDYQFNPTSIPPQPTNLPYATVRLQSDNGRVLTSASPAVGWRLLAALHDLLVAAFALSLLVIYLSGLRKVWVPVVVSLAAIAIVATRPELSTSRGTYFVLSGALLIVLTLGYRSISPAAFGLASFTTLAAMEMTRAVATYGSITGVIYRGAGQDFLTYESLARSILESGSLHGGENVFVYSPAFRYLLFASHLLLGDGDILIAAASILAIVFGLFLVAHRLLHPLPNPSEQRRPRRVKGRDLLLIFIVLSLILLVQTVAVDMVRILASEFATWILLIFGFYCLLRAVHPGRRLAGILGAALIAAGATTRFDQGPGLVALFLVLCVAVFSAQPSSARRFVGLAPLVIVMVAVSLLPALHNAYYGHQLVVLPQSPNIPTNFPIPLSKAFAVFSDPHVHQVFVDQGNGILNLIKASNSPGFIGAQGPFGVAIVLLQAAWLVCLVRLLIGWRRMSLVPRLMILLPVFYLAPLIFLQVYIYYPRHIIAGYLAMGLAAAYTLSDIPETYRAKPAKESRQGEAALGWVVDV